MNQFWGPNDEKWTVQNDKKWTVQNAKKWTVQKTKSLSIKRPYTLTQGRPLSGLSTFPILNRPLSPRLQFWNKSSFFDEVQIVEKVQ